MAEKKYWKGIEELRSDAEFVRLKNNEFFEHLPVGEQIGKKAEENSVTPRRDFLKFMGFSVAAATLAACETPVVKSIPYVIKPEEVYPGIANYYASTFWDGYDYCPVVVKTREGRPIKIEGNELSAITKGGTSARTQASVLSLYDSERLKKPMVNGNPASWTSINTMIPAKLAEIAGKNGNIRILSSTIISPTTKKIIEEFSKKYPGTKHVVYDSISCSGMIKANKESFGIAALPTYRFDNADVIVSFGADFLANWISPIESARQYAEGRKLNGGKKKMSRHIQFEPTLSLTGSNADKRIAVKPTQQPVLIANLYNEVAKQTGGTAITAPDASELKNEIMDAARHLVAAKGRALVVARTNNTAVQNMVNAINVQLESYGSTINLAESNLTRQGDDAALKEFLAELKEGKISALLIYGCNPSYTLPNAGEFNTALKKVELSVSFSDRNDETASNCKFVCPDNHYLESWGDAEAKSGHISFMQPTIAPLFDTKQFQETMMIWAGIGDNYQNYLAQTYADGWQLKLKDGVFMKQAEAPAGMKFSSEVIAAAATEISAMKSPGGMELVLYEKTGIGNGNQANNPWLQEFPDPISRITWDNYLCVSPKDAREKGWNNNNLVLLSTNGVKGMPVPVYIQPGQPKGVVALAFGYGRTHCGKVANNLGKNAFAFARLTDNGITFWSECDVQKSTEDDYSLASTQMHHTMMGRAIVKETTLEDYIREPNAGNPAIVIPVHKGHEKKEELPADKVNLWDSFETPNHKWGMSIDLNSCIGCGACVIACTAENNVHVVGKDEIMRSREMHWIRIDRYYSSDADPDRDNEESPDAGRLRKMEEPSDNPKVVFQPVMCQHCNHAPCETVCPVVATNHSSEGLNQMAYNRCIGTRYCANNCPYKVRRFNWFQYDSNKKFENINPAFHSNEVSRMVLNPDVVVRSRGVMEKCSLCVQRIQDGKLTAKKESRKLKDGEINTACAQACPTHAIVFGDYNDKASELNKMFKPKERSYHLLEELDVQPNVFYQTKVRNVERGKRNEA